MSDELDFEPPEPSSAEEAKPGFDFVEYLGPDQQKWRVERGSDLISTFGLEGPEMLTAWHGAMTSGDSAQGKLRPEQETWTVLRRLFGIAPLMGVEDPEELRVWDVGELAAKMAVSERVVENHVAGAKMFWKRWSAEHPPSPDSGPKSPTSEKSEGMDNAEVSRLLSEQGFVEVESAEERQYIASRIRALEPWLDDDNLRSTARNLISQEVNLFFIYDPSIRELRRKIKDIQVNTKSIPEKETKNLLDLNRARREEQAAMEVTLKTLGMTEASGGGLKKKMAFGDFLSGLLDAMKAFHSQEDRGLIDGIFEAAEIEILSTPTMLRPIQYRPDLIVSLHDALEHLWEKDWSPTPLSRRVCRLLNDSFGKALAVARAEAGEVPRADFPEEEAEGGEVETTAAPVAPAVTVTALAKGLSALVKRRDEAPVAMTM